MKCPRFHGSPKPAFLEAMDPWIRSEHKLVIQRQFLAFHALGTLAMVGLSDFFSSNKNTNHTTNPCQTTIVNTAVATLPPSVP